MNIFTLGPEKTNLEEAALKYKSEKCDTADIILCPTLEIALEKLMASKEEGVLLACVAYPKLHELIFNNLQKIELIDIFVMDTLDMVLAKNDRDGMKSIATHPAPEALIKNNYKRYFVNSNSEAAIYCSKGKVGFCITTIDACIKEELEIVENFGGIPMGFSVHRKI